MTFENYIAIAIGLVAVGGGPLLVRHRAKVFRVIADTNRAFGGAAGREVGKRSSPWWIGFCGVGLTLIGVVAGLVGIFARE